MNKFDWRSHSVGLGILFFAFVFLITSFYVRYVKEADLLKLKSQVLALRNANRSSEEELKVLNAYSIPYASNKSRGLIGDARKLNWIESLDSVSKEIGIYDVQFTLENTRKMAESETSFYNYDIPIYLTDMYLDLSLLHEGDLYLLLNKIRNRSEGIFSVEACEVRRIGTSVSIEGYGGLKAKCHFRWFNLDDVTKAWAEYESVDAS